MTPPARGEPSGASLAGITVPGPRARRARAPGRVNLIGDHTDYNQGLALPMAIDLGVTVELTTSPAASVSLYSTLGTAPVTIDLHVPLSRKALAEVTPPWARMAAAVVAVARPSSGGVARVATDLPVGAGLSSSAAFCLALLLALGVEGEPLLLARMGQQAEAAAGSDVGLLDYLAATAARPGAALLIDFATLHATPIPLPANLEVVVVHSGVSRTLATTPYAARRAECAAATVELGRPLGQAEEADIPGLRDPILRQRTRHVVTESRRVRTFAAALANGDLVSAGALMAESHLSLAGDFAASHPVVDELVAALGAAPGVYGARITGGGFGGCVVALAAPGALDPLRWDRGAGAWRLRPTGPAWVEVAGGL